MVKSLKQLAFEFRLKLGYSTAFVLLLVSYILSLYGNKQLMKQTAWVNHSNKTINTLETLISGVKDAETGVRGYINTRDTSFLLPYRNSRAIVDSAFNILQLESANNSEMKDYLSSLSVLINERYDKLQFAIDNFPKSNYRISDSLLVSFYLGKAKMDRNESPSWKSICCPSRGTARFKRFNLCVVVFILPEAHRRTGMPRFVTVAMREVIFHKPVFVGDLVSFYAETLRIGTTSITVRVIVEAERVASGVEQVRVTEAEVVYVAVDEKREKTRINVP